MKTLRVKSIRSLQGTITVPGDKSISHRAVLFAALAQGSSRVRNFLHGGDCEATLNAVQMLGIEVERPAPDTLILHSPGPQGWHEPEDVIYCANSGTTIRLLMGMLGGQTFTSILTGSPQLRRRPMGRVSTPLRQMGVEILGRMNGAYAPLALRGGNIHGIEYRLPVASAQVKSALILAGLFAHGETIIHEPGPARDHSERMLRALGADVLVERGTIRVSPLTAPLSALDLVVPGDFSSASFFIVLGALVGDSTLTIRKTNLNPTRTGLLDALRDMGASIDVQNRHTMEGEEVGDIVVRTSSLRGVEISGPLVVRMIDEFPIFAVAATQAQGTTLVRDAAELRVKETDRIATVVAELRKMGADIEEREDGFLVHGPTQLQGAHVESHGDHRLAMALTVAGLIAQGETLIHDVECIADSNPTFLESLASLGALEL